MRYQLEHLGTFEDMQEKTRTNVFRSALASGGPIESALILNREDTDVVCLPSMTFCPLGCSFCHISDSRLNKTGELLTYVELREAVYRTVRRQDESRITDNKLLLLAFMGVGEPFLNLALLDDTMMNASELMKMNGYDHIGLSLSSMFPNENVYELAEVIDNWGIPVKVHYSLLTPDDAKRREMVPAAQMDARSAFEAMKRYSDRVRSDEALAAAYDVFHPIHPIPVAVHYTLIGGVNDSDEELSALLELLREFGTPIKFLPPANDLPHSDREDKWFDTITSELPDLVVKRFAPPGHQSGPSCSEFTRHYYHGDNESGEERKAFDRWQEKHSVED